MRQRNKCLLRNSANYLTTIIPNLVKINANDPRSGLKARKNYLKLTKGETILIVQDVLNNPMLDDARIKKSYEDYLQELTQSSEKQFILNVVDDKELFKLKLGTPSIMYDFLSNKLNTLLYTEMSSEIGQFLAGFTKQKTIVTDSDSLQLAILDFQSDLLTLCKNSFLNTIIDSCTFATTTDFYQLYKNILLNVEKNLVRYINENGGKINKELSSDFRKDFFNVLKAWTILNNFDTLVEKLSHGNIVVTKAYKGVINTEESKYSQKDDKYSEASFLDGYAQVDGAHITLNVLKEAFSGIELNEVGDKASVQLIRQFVQNISHIAADTETDSGIGSYIREFFNKEAYGNNADLDITTRKLEFLAVLKDPSIISKLGEKSRIIANWFAEYEDAFLTFMPREDIDKQIEYCTLKDLLGMFLNTIHTLQHVIYCQTTENGNEFVTSVDRGLKKWNIYEDIANQALHNASNGQDRFYAIGFEVAPEQSGASITDLFSEKALSNLRKIFGFSFKNIAHIYANENIGLIGDCISLIQELYAKHFMSLGAEKMGDWNNEINLESAKEAFKNDLVRDSRFIRFSDELVKFQSEQLHNLHDLNDNILPGESIYTTVGSFATCRTEFEKHFPNSSCENILCKFKNLTSIAPSIDLGDHSGNFIGHTTFRSDINIGGKIIPHVLLEPSELMTVALSFDFLKSIFDGDVFCLLTEAYSDKPRVPIQVYNLFKSINIKPDVNKNFITLTDNEIKDLYRKQHQSYFLQLESELCNKWNNLLGTSYNSVELLLTYLNQQNFTWQAIHDKIEQYQLLHPSEKFNFIKDSDYIIIGDIDKSNKVTLNASLLLKIAAAKNDNTFDILYQEGENAFLLEMESGQDIPNLFRPAYGTLNTNEKEKLCLILGLEYEQNASTGEVTSKALNTFLNNLQTTWNQKDSNGKLTDISRSILKRYYVIQTLFKDAELQIGIKQPWIHDASGIELSTQDMAALSAADLKVINDILKKDYLKRLIKGKKRNSSAVAAFTPMEQGLKFGVPRTMKVAMVKFPTYHTQNHFGTEEDLNPHDGASHTDAIWSFYEEHSYLGHNYKGPKKTIGLIPHFGGFTLIKHADQIMSNEWIRTSFIKSRTESQVNIQFDGDHLVKIMRSPCKLTELFSKQWYENQLKTSNKIEFNSPIFSFNGKLAQLDKITFKTENDTLVLENGCPIIKFEWKYLGSNEYVSQNLVNGMIPNADIREDYVLIKDLYQLWKAFGGSESQEEIEDGSILFTEISNELCAQLICEFDPSMKEKLIAKICDPESVKSSQIAVNTASDLSNGHLTVGYLDTFRYGLQQDYTHESEDAKIPALTQVITAIAFNGHNLPLINNAYETLGKLVENSLRPLMTTRRQDPEKYYRYLGEKLLKSLLSNSVASSATELVYTYLEDLLKSNIIKSDDNLTETKIIDGRSVILPFSHKDLFYKISSDLVSKLNQDTIKLQFSGIAVIQCPSLGIIGLYEDIEGNVYTRTDILKLALQQDFSNIDKLLSGQDLIDYFLINNPKFASEEINTTNLDKLNIGDIVFYNGVTKIINSPNDLLFIYNLIKSNSEINIYKIHSKQRELGVTKITWKNLNTNEILNLFCINSTLELAAAEKNSEEYLLCLEWHRANLAGLQKGYYYANRIDFLNNILTPIYDLKYTPGEQVIPKVHTAFNEQHYSLSEILNKGEDFFKNQITKALTILSSISSKDIGIALDNAEIIISENPNPEISTNTIIEYDSDIMKNCIKDVNGEVIITVPDNFDGIATLDYEKDKPTLHIYLSNFNLDFITKLVWEHIDGKDLQRINNIILGKRLTPEFQDLLKFAHALINNDLIETIEKRTKAAFNSWKLSHYTISTRIPSQSYQSFLATKTVAYTEDNLNRGYMNIWEMWFLGSDFDIDKAYTLMFGVDKKGIISGNRFTNYDSIENILQSLNLTLPKYFIDEQTGNDITALLLTEDFLKKYPFIIVKNDLENTTINWNKIKEEINNNNYRFIDDFINLLNENQIIFWPKDENLDKESIRLLFIQYRNEGSESLKNRIANAIWTQTTDLRNLESAEQPMSMKPVTNVIEKIRKIKHEKENALKPITELTSYSKDIYYSEYNPFTLFKIQRANSVGKDDVGIAANGVKAAGALHLHFNKIYRNWDEATQDLKKKQQQDRSKINLSLSFSRADGSFIGLFKFFKLANTKMPKELFIKELIRTCGSDFNGHPDYLLYSQLINNQLTPDLINMLSSRLKKFKLIYDLFISRFGIGRLNFPNLLYYAQQFEDNVADIISIFISMATDNAKELALAKINATPELLSMPLAMLTLGIDIESTVDICINVLGEVADRLATNRYLDSGYKNVRNIILGLTTPSVSGITFDQETVNSLLHIYDFALELRSITSFFKVNQGVTTKYTELKSWISNLANGRMTAADSKGIKKYGMFTSADLLAPLEFSRLFEDSQYKQSILDQYEISKEIVNVMDVVLESPHFREQLKATDEVLTGFEHISAKSTIVDALVNISNVKVPTSDSNIQEDHTPDNIRPAFGQYSKLALSAIERKSDLKMLMDRVIKLVDHWVITEYLSTNDNLDISIADIQKIYPTSKFNNYASIQTINFDTAEGINQFLDFMNYDLIPSLLEKFAYNAFIDGLETATDKKTKKKYFDFKYDPYKVKDNPTLLENFNIAQSEFEYIKNVGSGLHSLSGREFTIGELLYLYSVIISRGEIRGLYTIVQRIGKESDLLLGGIDEQYRRLDELIQYPNKPILAIAGAEENTQLSKTNYDILLQIIDQLRPYVKALASDKLTTRISTKQNHLTSDSNEYVLNLNKEFLYTLNKPKLAENQEYSVTNGFDNIARYIETQIPLSRVTIEPTPILNGLNPNEIMLHVSLELFDELGQCIKPKIPYKINDDSSTVRILINQDQFGKSITQEQFDLIFLPLLELAKGTKKYVLNKILQLSLQHTSLANNQFINIDSKIIDILPSDIKKFLESSINVKINQTGNSFIRKFGNTILYELNINQFVDSDQATLKLVKLYLLLQNPDCLSDHQLRVNLLQWLTGRPFSYTEVDKQILFDKLKLEQLYNEIKAPDAKTKLKLIDFYINFSDNLDDVKDTRQIQNKAHLTLAEYETALENPDFYYIPIPENSNIELELETGDICNINGQRCLFISTDEEGRRIFTTLDGTATVILKSLTEPIKISEKKIARSTIRFGKLTSDMFTYNNPEKELHNLYNVIVGDLIIISDKKKYLVTDILYYQLGDYKCKLIVLLDQDGKLHCLRANATLKSVWREGKKIQSLIPKEEFTIYRSKDITALSKTNNVDWLPFNSTSEKIKNLLLQYLDFGAYIKTKSGQVYKVSGKLDKILTTTGEEINIEDIELVQLGITNLELDQFFGLYKPKTYWDSGEVGYVIKWRPELIHGFLKSEPLRIPGKTTKSTTFWTEITACKVINDQLYPNIALSSDMIKTELPTYKKGDIYITYLDGTTNIYLIIDPDEKIAAKVSYKFLEDQTCKLTSKALVEFSDNLFRFADHYTNYKNYYNKTSYYELKRTGTDGEVSINEAGLEFLQYIQNTLGVKVEFITDPISNIFAQVKEDKLLINVAKKPANLNISVYIMSQAAHEFTHLLLANLKVHNPSVYAKLIQDLQTKLSTNSEMLKKFIDLKLDSNIYSNEILQLEEFLVRIIEENVSQLNEDFTMKNIKDIINTEFKNLFLLKNLDKLEYNLTLKSIFRRFSSDFIKSAESGFNIQQVRTNRLNEDVFKRTKIIC